MNKNRCVVWGSGLFGKKIIDAVRARYEIVFYVDSDIQKQGGEIQKIPICSPSCITNMPVDVNTVIIGIKDDKLIEEVRGEITKLTERQIIIVSGKDLYNEHQNEYLNAVHLRHRFNWEVDFEQQFEDWIHNIDEEVNYWKNDVLSEEGMNHNYYVNICNKHIFDDSAVLPLINAGLVVMDVGCGLVSPYSNLLPSGDEIRLIPVDALAYFYNRMLQEKARPQNNYQCLFGMFEFLDLFFEKDYADCIIINNALDHCIDPFRALLSVIKVLKCGGSIFMRHTRATALLENYSGLHKWNLDFIDDHFVIWNETNMIDISEKFSAFADIEIKYNDTSIREGQILEIIIKKKEEISDKIFLGDSAALLAYCIKCIMDKLASVML